MHRGWATVLLAGILAAAVGCGGGGGGDPDPLARLEGSWFGPSSAGTLRITVDGAGQVTELSKDGNPSVVTGNLTHVSGRYYEGEIGGDDVRFFLDPTGRYAVFFTELVLATLQLGATALPPGGFQLGDIAPGAYEGTNLAVDASAAVVGENAATVSIAADGTYTGSDASGLTFGSTPGNPLAWAVFVYSGGYQDSLNPGLGFIEVLPSPDTLFLASASFPQANSTLANAALIGAWNRK